jgi:hypothetical protein
MDGRVLNPNWRGLPESSQLVDGTSAGADCSMGFGGKLHHGGVADGRGTVFPATGTCGTGINCADLVRQSRREWCNGERATS